MRPQPRVLVTRPRGQADELLDLLRAGDVEPVHVPTVAIGAADRLELRTAMFTPTDPDWLVVTSRNGAEAVVEALDGRPLPEVTRVAAIGPATADALRRGGIGVDVVPQRYLSVEIADSLGDVRGRRVVLARADAATPQLHDALLRSGGLVEEVVAYRTVEGPPSSREPLAAALAGGLDAVCFSSGSTVRGFLALLPLPERRRARRLPAFCIGPVTAGVAEQEGFAVAAVATEHTARGLAAAAIHHFRQETP